MGGEKLPLCSKCFGSPILVTVRYLNKFPVYTTFFTHWQFLTHLLVLWFLNQYFLLWSMLFQLYFTTDILNTLCILFFIGPLLTLILHKQIESCFGSARHNLAFIFFLWLVFLSNPFIRITIVNIEVWF